MRRFISPVLGLCALVLVGCATGGGGTNANQLSVANDSLNTIEALVWAGDALPPDPNASLKQDAAIANTVPAGDLWRFDLPLRTASSDGATSDGATGIIATIAVRAQGQSLDQSQWINVEGPRPWAIRVFGEAPNLRVARVLQQDDTGRMQRTVGPRPPSVVTGGFGSGPQR
ncbi:MAG: hypothetical protein JNK16_13595 [Phycisphaerales bacterium]|nr:hypothetical protein [Phycisphaerales bacterium]